MRLVKQIPHPMLTIQVFNYNDKYILKVEIDQFEQSYKVPVMNVDGVDALEELLTPAFLEGCMHRFIEMRKDFSEGLNM